MFNPKQIREDFKKFVIEKDLRKVGIFFRPKNIKMEERHALLLPWDYYADVSIGDDFFYNIDRVWSGEYEKSHGHDFSYYFDCQAFVPLAFFQVEGRFGSVIIQEIFCACGFYWGSKENHMRFNPFFFADSKTIPLLWADGLSKREKIHD